MGRQAVMIFFVLSGFLISRGIDQKIRSAEWSWTEYLTNRFSRLWVVLVPCLIITFMWDSLSIQITGSLFYEGRLREVYCLGPKSGVPVDLGWLAFFRNSFFLQDISGSVYGSNISLWSLSYEFWYYLLFPLLYLALYRKGKIFWFQNIYYGLFALLIIFMLPSKVLFLGFIWALGFMVHIVNNTKFSTRFSNRKYLLIAIVLFLGVLFTTRAKIISQGLIADYSVGVAAAYLILVLVHRVQLEGGVFQRFSKFLSSISYSLYATHFAFIAFIAFVFNSGKLFPINGDSLLIFVVVFIMTILHATIFYHIFEKNTYRVKKSLFTLVVRIIHQRRTLFKKRPA